jgi:copper(I)-binding protein
VSRAEHPTTQHAVARRRVLAGLVPSVLGLGLAALLTGCGAGQISQTATQVPAVNGASGSVGPIAIRDVQLAPPNNAQQVYQPGSTARLIATIVNTGLSDDTLVKITSPAVTSITIDGSANGTKVIPGGFAVASGVDDDDMTVNSSAGSSSVVATTPSTPAAPSGASSPSGSAQPSASSAPVPPAKITIDLVAIKSINGGPLRAGMTIPMTFYFAHAGQVTLQQVPIGAPADNASLQSSANG